MRLPEGIFLNASDITSHLIKKFGKKESPNYQTVEVAVSALEAERASRHKKIFKTIAGSASFHVMYPNLVSYFLLLPQEFVSVTNAAMNTGLIKTCLLSNKLVCYQIN